ncbi:E3 ubiquitin-protein ligase TRIM39-like isoform X2 [Salvelinus alpinus]|uniref:E3 ubiquitin-protein ligase TRIM39-like isoform X2 n=1 Tax=Salvelinus alpinus TaxID=8036 RepID=UPI0039FC098B
MKNWTAETLKDSQSLGSFSKSCGKVTHPYDCRSEPFGKPNLSLYQTISRPLKKCNIIVKNFLKGPSRITTLETSQSPSLDECKVIIRELATELHRISKYQDNFTSSHEDGYSLAECQQFILQWAEELSILPKISVGQSRSSPKALRTCWEDYEVEERTSPKEAERRLAEAQRIVSEWAAGLQSRRQDSVYPGEDVCSVLQDLEGQWKRGKLPNMLPVMDFLIWTVLQEQPQEGSIPELWLKSKQRFKHSAFTTVIPEPVWDWISKASVDILLDPESANPDFIVSNNQKRVRVGKIIESKNDPRDGYGHYRASHKYDGWWCALGTQGFTKGRHYWEVGVEGKTDWRIGITRESAPRRGFVELNTSTGYWTLRMQVSGLKALAVPAVDIKIPEHLKKIGVYLDIEEGQLSFYDVVARSHIYTFNDTFSEQVYPVFGTVETDRDLVIL